MITIVLDGELITSEKEFHKQISKKLEFPSYYGNNLDAFWDCFTDFLVAPRQDKVVLLWKNHEVSKNGLGAESFNKILDLISSAGQKWRVDLTINLS